MKISGLVIVSPAMGEEYHSALRFPRSDLNAITALGVLKSLINVYRDGLGGLLKKQPPVE
jgi:hypothetical protein